MYRPASGVYYFSSLESSLWEWLSDNLISDSYEVDVLILSPPPPRPLYLLQEQQAAVGRVD